MAFDTQITDLVGGTIDQTACDQWAADACKEIIHQLPAKLQAKCATRSTLNASATTLDLDSKGDILHITRLSADSGGYEKPCREIAGMYGDLTNDPNDLTYYATATDPVFFITNNSSGNPTLFVRPNPTNTQPSYVHHISYPTVDVSAVSVIANFPDEAEYLVVLYVAIKQLHQYMNSKRSDLPSDLVIPVLELISESLPTWSAPDDLVVPVKPAVPSISSQSVSDPSSYAPTYVKPVVPSRVAFSSYTSGLSETDPGVLQIIAVTPVTPTPPSFTTPSIGAITVGSTTLTNLGVAPTYTSPTQTISGTIWATAYPDEYTALNTALGKISTELDDTRAICDDVGTSANSAITALGNMATEIALANAEVGDALTEIAEAIGLVDNASNIQVAVDGMKMAASKFQAEESDPALFGDEDTYNTGDGLAQVGVHLGNAASLIGFGSNGDKYANTHDLEANMLDIDTELGNEDIELASGRMQQAQTQMAAVGTHINLAQGYIADWNAATQTLVAEVNAFASEASARYGWINAKAVVWQGELSAAQGYMATAGGYANQANGFNSTAQSYATEVQARINVASGYANEVKALLSQTPSKVSEYQSKVQDALNEYNKENISYQAKLQEATQQAQINAQKAQQQAQLDATDAQQEASLLLQKEQQEYASKLQKYQAELSDYQADVNAQVQQYGQKLQHYSTELNTAYQAWAKTESDSLSQYSTDIQNELNEFNKENAKYQAILQEYIQEAQLLDAHEARKLQKYQAEVGTYSAELNTNVQAFTQALTKNRAAFDTSMQKYTSDVQKVSSSNASTLQKFTGEVGNFSAKLQKQSADYTWYQGQYTQLKADYASGLAALKGTQQQGE